LTAFEGHLGLRLLCLLSSWHQKVFEQASRRELGGVEVGARCHAHYQAITVPA
jgi:hypothetical protein